MACILCGANEQLNQQILTIKKSVSSDCRQVSKAAELFQCMKCGHYQKPINSEYIQNVTEIYESYTPYSLKSGQEQLSYSAELPFTRCSKILLNCKNLLPGAEASLLDIGTGSGVMLEAISNLEKGWQLHAHDVSTHQSAELIEKFHLRDFYSKSLSDISKKFDVITLVHVLEHVSTPLEFLDSLQNLLSESGIIIIQVPNINENPWDFAIFDHISHFTAQRIESLLREFFDFVYFPENQISKEITVIASNHNSVSANAGVKIQTQSCPMEAFQRYVQQLESLPACYVLGTGPAASFSAYMLGDCLLGWLDEDKNKIGKYLEGHKINDANNVYDAPILLPYPLAQVEEIIKRLPNNEFIKCY
ncbi:hypothetical protein CBQ28_11515 [Pseudoalteromonas sp. GCY]|uniref:class I SAM-dependent methyltransferase n=1 Tax=Pseudoalteromonas sp. GCY TaxID=2003316 RepID=UPI000BFEB131|nr:class I SAM-dependent methyltransferase [Pseudoalteromonas sp. GCY]PHI36925.1 hypothetical protein CBQ28_11515 [Pseudoalteromonas sp. GCY]QQQ68318.1 class I SAM-dependent methyltransferase [Pseudoalteromonas sp. GCY]